MVGLPGLAIDASWEAGVGEAVVSSWEPGAFPPRTS